MRNIRFLICISVFAFFSGAVKTENLISCKVDFKNTFADSHTAPAIITCRRHGNASDLAQHIFKATEKELKFAPEIIAHRGYWNISGSAQNSIKAIEKAQELHLFGTETDVRITSDGVAVLNHDATLNGVNIENSTYEQIRNLTLSNGEKTPTLEQALEQTKRSDKTKLIIEIKTHASSSRSIAAAKAAVEAVKAAGLEKMVEYIAFSLEVCEELVRLDSEAMVAYLNGDLAPETLFDKGIKGIDYNIAVLRKNPQWIRSAQALGMTVNVWTVNDIKDIIEMANAGVNYITTDNPLQGLTVRDSISNLKPFSDR